MDADAAQGARGRLFPVVLCSRRTPEDLESLMPLHPRIRLVKGAYAEHPRLAFRKKDVDLQYVSLAETLLAAAAGGLTIQVLGTHDMSISQACDHPCGATRVRRAASRFTCCTAFAPPVSGSALRGVRRALSDHYGNQWFPWYMRRLAEHSPRQILVCGAKCVRPLAVARAGKHGASFVASRSASPPAPAAARSPRFR